MTVNYQLGPTNVNLFDIVQDDNWTLALPPIVDAGGNPVNLTGLTTTAEIVTATTTYHLTVTVIDAAQGLLSIGQTNAPLINNANWALRSGGKTYFSGSVTGVPDILT